MLKLRVGVLLAASLLIASCVDDEADPSSEVADQVRGDVDEEQDVDDDYDDDYDDVDEDVDEDYEDYEDEDYEDDVADDDSGDEAVDDEGGSDGGGLIVNIGDGTFFESDCPFDNESEFVIDCGYVEVPESRLGLSDNTVRLAIAIIRTPVDNPDPDPVVYLHGGPGGQAVEDFAGFLWAESWEDDTFLDRRDVILVDQRGNGISEPALACEEGEDIGDCYDRFLEMGISLASYSTPENAADIESIRLALGYDEWNIYGSSYGTRLGLVVLRNYPQGVRSLILAGVYPPNKVPAYEDFMGNTFRVLDVMADECLSQADCNETYGDLYSLLINALYAAGEVSEEMPQALFDTMFQAIYDMGGVANTPQALLLAAEGLVDEAIELLGGGEAGGAQARRVSPGSIGQGPHPGDVFLNFDCREEQGFTSLEVVEAQADEYREAGWDDLLVDVILSGAVAESAGACTFWDSGLADPSEREPVVSDAPVLLLSGEFDPITPPSWGDLAQETLSGSTHIVAPKLSHGLVGGVDSCIETVIFFFLMDPSVQPDVSCEPSTGPVEFTLP